MQVLWSNPIELGMTGGDVRMARDRPMRSGASRTIGLIAAPTTSPRAARAAPRSTGAVPARKHADSFFPPLRRRALKRTSSR